ncbi:hypothetical protein Zmor_020553 [Zophobas morio]|uniref:Uncharacterized protein n=1 Tax=Zophobas morio TaxID=2755281 RepID=A0AA38I6Y6_9CUCU|nr:hypothetical protein Zmor_020553 [Zophobas morio]
MTKDQSGENILIFDTTTVSAKFEGTSEIYCYEKNHTLPRSDAYGFDDGGRAAFVKEKPGSGTRDGYSRKTPIAAHLEGSMGLNRGHLRKRLLFSRVESREC